MNAKHQPVPMVPASFVLRAAQPTGALTSTFVHCSKYDSIPTASMFCLFTESAAIIELQAKHNVTSNITHVKFDLYGK